MGFVGYEEDQDVSGVPEQAGAGYGYPRFNQALLAGFAPGGPVRGERQAAAQTTATAPIGERIVDMTRQQTQPAHIAAPEKEPETAAPPRVADMQQPLAALDGLTPPFKPAATPGLAAANSATPALRRLSDSSFAASAAPSSAGMNEPAGAQQKASGNPPAVANAGAGKNPQSGGTVQPKQEGQSAAGAGPGQQGTAASNAVSADLRTQARMMVPGGVQTVRVKAGKTGAKGGQPASRRIDNIGTYLPAIQQALAEKNMADPDMMQYVLATISAETGGFKPLTEGQGSSNTVKTPFDKYDYKNGNQGPPDGERYRGRGFIQLTGRDNYRIYGKKIGHPELVDHPEMANDPEIAAKLLRAYLEDHQTEIRKQIALAKADPLQAEKTFALFMKYNADAANADPGLKKALSGDSLVMARKQVNGPNATIPNGLEHFLPAYVFAGRNNEIAAQSRRNANMTVGDAARIWTRGDDAGQKAYLAALQKRTGISPDTKLSDLTADQREKLESAQGRYVTGVMVKAEGAVKARARFIAKARAEAKAKQANGQNAGGKTPQASGPPARGGAQPARPVRNGQPVRPQRPAVPRGGKSGGPAGT